MKQDNVERGDGPVLVVENRDSGAVERFEAEGGQIHLPKGDYALKGAFPVGVRIHLKSTLWVHSESL